MKTLITILCLVLAPLANAGEPWTVAEKGGLAHLAFHEARAFGVTFFCGREDVAGPGLAVFGGEPGEGSAVRYGAHIRVYLERDVRLNYGLDQAEADRLAASLLAQAQAEPDDDEGTVRYSRLEVVVELDNYVAALGEFSEICERL